jgi:SprT-like family protein
MNKKTFNRAAKATSKIEQPIVTPSLERQQWLEHAVEALRSKFTEAGYSVPQKIRVSIGWPKRAASCGAIGECWSASASSDQHHELFISPELTESTRIMDVLAHEMTHATVGTDAGHKKAFKQCAITIGLQGPMRATTASPAFVNWAQELFKRIGLYPAGFLTDTPKQGTRTIKCECSVCGYIARVTKKWLEAVGPPICPTDQIPFTVKGESSGSQNAETEIFNDFGNGSVTSVTSATL